MIKASTSLQDLRRKIYDKAKAEPTLEKSLRRHLARACQRSGFGWKRWSSAWLYKKQGLFRDYRLDYYPAKLKTLPARTVS